MKFPDSVRIPLNARPEQWQRLLDLQTLFAQACNSISPVAKLHRCWNRVALHHLVYRAMREKYSDLGSQMICNAVYSVCRVYRLVYENPNSPFYSSIRNGGDLPLIKFLPTTPVYFDRHTLSIKENTMSLFTLDGRMRFQINLEPDALLRFKEERLREITLIRDVENFELIFDFRGDSSDKNKIIDLAMPNYTVFIQEVNGILSETMHDAMPDQLKIKAS